MSAEENRVLSICTRVPAACSVVCSSYIAYSVISNQQKRSSPTQRIVLGMSCSDIIFSFFWFLGPWPIPRETENVLGAMGTTQTCSIQGFFVQFSAVMTPMYNGFLASYVFLYVCRDRGGQWLKYLEIFGHALIFTVGLSTAIVGLALNLYNSGRMTCWIWPLPENCTQSFESIDGTTDCIRGDNASLYQFVLTGAMLWFNLLWTFFSMTSVYLHVRKQEKKMEAYIAEYDNSSGSSKRRAHSDSRDVAIKGALFTGAFLLAFLPATIDRCMDLAGATVFAVEVLVSILSPSQGIFNLFVYIVHPAVSQHLQEKELQRTDLQNMTEKVQDEQTANKDEDVHLGQIDGDSRALTRPVGTVGTGTDEETKSDRSADD